MKAIGYARVSTEEQAGAGVSLEVQRERIKAFCQAKGWELHEIITDPGHSGKDLRRPGIQEVISLCLKRVAEVVVIAKLDRLTRHVADLGYLTRDVLGKNSVALASVQESIDATTAAGQLMLNILGSVAQWERDVISERTKEALAYRKKEGKRVGAVPYGYDLSPDGKTLVSNPREKRCAQTMLRLRSKGLSYQRIARQLNQLNVKSKMGGRWYAKTVRSVVLNKYGP